MGEKRKEAYEPLLQQDIVVDRAVLTKGDASAEFVDIEGQSPDSSQAVLKTDISHASMGRLMKFLRAEACIITIATLALIVSTTCQLAQPYFFGRIVLVCSSTDSDHTRRKELGRYAFVLLVILFIGGVAATIRGWLYTLVGERVVRSVLSIFNYGIPSKNTAIVAILNCY